MDFILESTASADADACYGITRGQRRLFLGAGDGKLSGWGLRR